MAPDRDDGIEEEPFEIDLPEPAEEVPEEEAPEEYEEEYGEAEAEEGVARGGREKLEAVVSGLSTRSLGLILAGVVAFAVVLVVFAVVTRGRKKKAEKDTREREYVENAVKLAGALHQMGVEYFSAGGRIPAGFRTRFVPAGDQDEERRYVVGVAIQSRDPRSVTFKIEATAFNHKFTPLGEVARHDPKPLPGTNVYMYKGRIAIKLDNYDVRIFRQNILDDKGTVVGRVALMMFERPK